MEEKIWQLEIVAHGEQIDLIQGLLTLAVAAGWEEKSTGPGEMRFFIQSEREDFLRKLEREVELLTPGANQTLKAMDKTDWLQAWRQFFTPVECGSQFVVLPPWLAHMEHARRKAIIIEPRSAFGTGHHVSTRLCLKALSDLADEGRIKRKGWFLDLGCGTGVLGLAACKLGMDGTGLDIDPVAIANARENRELNEATRLELLKGGIEKVKGEKFDLVMANILARPLEELAPQIMGCLRDGGALILGGILDKQAEEVSAAYAPLGHPRTITEGEWAALAWSQA